MKKFLYISILIFSKAFGQDSISVQRYIAQYKDIAMAEMLRTGVPAAITLAQGIHESGAGKSDLVTRSNNHFGIKCKNTWTGRTVHHDDDASQECFRAYDSSWHSYKDHSDFLRNNQRYAFLFGYNATDYASWARGLKQAGYATNPRYAPVLIGMIEKYHLNDYTLLAMNIKVPAKTDEIAMYAQAIHYTQKVEETIAAQQEPVEAIADAAVMIEYPSGIFSINNCKVMSAPKGTSLLALAFAHKVSMPNLIAWNDMNETDITPENQLIFLEKKQKKGEGTMHEVKPGETLWHISQTEGIRLSNLLQYNQLTLSDIPAVGEKIYLQSSAAQKPRLASQKIR